MRGKAQPDGRPALQIIKTGGTPQISDSHLKITVTTEHVAKFGDDRPRDLLD